VSPDRAAQAPNRSTASANRDAMKEERPSNAADRYAASGERAAHSAENSRRRLTGGRCHLTIDYRHLTIDYRHLTIDCLDLTTIDPRKPFHLRREPVNRAGCQTVDPNGSVPILIEDEAVERVRPARMIAFDAMMDAMREALKILTPQQIEDFPPALRASFDLESLKTRRPTAGFPPAY